MGFQDAKVHCTCRIFRSWKKLHSLGRYDIIVIDPPSAQKAVVEKDYPKGLRKLHANCHAGGMRDSGVCECALARLCLVGELRCESAGAERIAWLPGTAGFDEAEERRRKPCIIAIVGRWSWISTVCVGRRSIR